MESKWVLKPEGNPDITEKLSKELNVEKIIVNMLVQRGIETFDDAKAFFRPELNHLHDPYLMKDMDKAISRLNKAFEKNEKILGSISGNNYRYIMIDVVDQDYKPIVKSRALKVKLETWFWKMIPQEDFWSSH